MSGGPWYYVYDGLGLRVAKCSSPSHADCTTGPTGGTLYWRGISGDSLADTDLSGSTSNAAASEYVFFAGRRIAIRNGSTGTVNYIYADQLGSTVSMTDASGVSCYTASFTPYGEEHASVTSTCANTNNYKFTGYERDTETGLDYAFFRYYNYRLGRFMSPDPLGGSITDPQALNRYAYVGNNPTNFTDPSGLFKKPCNPRNPASCINSWNDSGGGAGLAGPGGFGDFGGGFDGTAGWYNDPNSSVGFADLFVPDELTIYFVCDVPDDCGANGHEPGPGHWEVILNPDYNGPPTPGDGPQKQVNCGTLLPNGHTVGDVVRQERTALQNARLPGTNIDNGPIISSVVEFGFIASPGGPIDFKNNFKGQADAQFLGDAGNFAYYAIGSAYLSNSLLDAGASAYAIVAHGSLSSPSAQRVRGSALAANGCK